MYVEFAVDASFICKLTADTSSLLPFTMVYLKQRTSLPRARAEMPGCIIDEERISSSWLCTSNRVSLHESKHRMFVYRTSRML